MADLFPSMTFQVAWFDGVSGFVGAKICSTTLSITKAWTLNHEPEKSFNRWQASGVQVEAYYRFWCFGCWLLVMMRINLLIATLMMIIILVIMTTFCCCCYCYSHYRYCYFPRFLSSCFDAFSRFMSRTRGFRRQTSWAPLWTSTCARASSTSSRTRLNPSPGSC